MVEASNRNEATSTVDPVATACSLRVCDLAPPRYVVTVIGQGGTGDATAEAEEEEGKPSKYASNGDVQLPVEGSDGNPKKTIGEMWDDALSTTEKSEMDDDEDLQAESVVSADTEAKSISEVADNTNNSSEEDDSECDYELQRQRNIEANNKMLSDLGLLAAYAPPDRPFLFQGLPPNA